MKTMNTKHIIVAALCVASFATADVVDTVFAKAKKAEDDGSVNFCGFYVGMSKADAEVLVSYYKLKDGESSIDGDPVYSINLSLKAVRRITKGGNSYDELCEAVENRVGSMDSRSTDYIFDDEWWYEYDTIDGIRVTMSEKGHSGGGIKAGLTMFDEEAEEAVERKAQEERNAAARRAREKKKQEALSWRSESKIIPISDSVSIELKSVPGPLWFGKTEITQGQWETVMGTPCPIRPCDRHFISNNMPAVCVSWNDCHQFLEKLNSLPSVKDTGLSFRLPSPSEWANACSAGSMDGCCMLADGTEITSESKSLGQVAWIKDNSSDRPHPVGQKTPNAFGLHDMLGNVWEWTDGKWETSFPEDTVICGGAYFNDSSWVNSYSQNREDPGKRTNSGLGFRICTDRKPELETVSELDKQQLESEHAKEPSENALSVPEGVIVVDAVESMAKCIEAHANPRELLAEVLEEKGKGPFEILIKADGIDDQTFRCFDAEDLESKFTVYLKENMKHIQDKAFSKIQSR